MPREATGNWARLHPPLPLALLAWLEEYPGCRGGALSRPNVPALSPRAGKTGKIATQSPCYSEDPQRGDVAHSQKRSTPTYRRRSHVIGCSPLPYSSAREVVSERGVIEILVEVTASFTGPSACMQRGLAATSGDNSGDMDKNRTKMTMVPREASAPPGCSTARQRRSPQAPGLLRRAGG